MATASALQQPPLKQFLQNLAEVERLLEIHSQVAGAGRGRKHNVEVLNKSAIVLLVACWEAFIEDLAAAGLAALVDGPADHAAVPPAVLERVANTPRRQCLETRRHRMEEGPSRQPEGSTRCDHGAIEHSTRGQYR